MYMIIARQGYTVDRMQSDENMRKSPIFAIIAFYDKFFESDSVKNGECVLSTLNCPAFKVTLRFSHKKSNIKDMS